jgi:catechol 2,3-dioxygenase-like lactoylglutathione lyase family enzyme
MDHLAREVSDQDRSRRFYETYCGFGVEVVEQWDEPDYVSVKCRDPDGHIVEFAWETT